MANTYFRERCMQLEEINSLDPNCFWEYINKLGSKNKTPIPKECYGTDGSIIYEENVVMNKWKEEFFNLYNPKEADGNESQNKFKDFIIKDNEDFEKLNGDDDMAINSSFSPHEVGKVISKSKANKAPGIHGIVYDVLRMKIPQFYSPNFLIYVLSPTKSRMFAYKALYILSLSRPKRTLAFHLITGE